MLSRVAENIYWLSRYVERAENTARLVRVNSHLVLDTPRGITPGWEPLVEITGLSAAFQSVEREPSERNVVRFLIGDAHNPGSILSSLAAARENCRTVRDVLPRSSWEKLNELYLFATDRWPARFGDVPRRGLAFRPHRTQSRARRHDDAHHRCALHRSVPR